MTFFINDNGEALDYDGDDVPISRQAVSFFEFKVKGDFSVSFKIPNTSSNRRKLGYYGPNQVNSPAQSKDSFTMVKDGNPISKGYIIIEGSDDDDIDAYFISGNASWFNSLKFNIRELNYDDYIVSMGDYDANKHRTDGIIFPVVDWAFNGSKLGYAFCHSTGKDGIQEFFPCFYLHNLVNAICRNANIKITSSLFNDAVFKQIIITPDGPEMTWPDNDRARSLAYVKRSATTALTGALQIVPFDSVIEQGSSPNYDAAAYRYTADRNMTLKITFQIYSSVSQSHQILGYKNGVQDALFVDTSTYYFGFFYMNLAKGDYAEVWIDGAAGFNLLVGSSVRYEIPEEIPAAFTDGVRNTTVDPIVTAIPYVTPAAIVPDVQAVDIIKWMIFYFGCSASFDTDSQVLSIEPLIKFNKAQAQDWSEYITSFYTDWKTGVAQNNRIQMQDGPEVESYNKQSLTRYGGGNIQTDFDSESENELYEMPFAPSYDQPCKTSLGWFLPYVGFYTLEDDLSSAVSFTTVTSSAVGLFTNSQAQFDVSGNTFIKDFDIVRVNSLNYSGYGVAYQTASNQIFIFGVDFTLTDTGTIIKQDVSSNSGACRILFCSPNKTVADLGGPNLWYAMRAAVGTKVNFTSPAYKSSQAAVAWFDKPRILEAIDTERTSLAIDPVLGRDYNTTIGDKYYPALRTAFNNPKIKAKMLLPTSVFTAFDFLKYVYISTPQLNGYFFVNKIERYKDASTEADVELINVNG